MSMFFVSTSIAQNGDKWEAWAENLAFKAERLAERVSYDAERTAEQLAATAEEIATDFEDKFDRGDFNINIKGIPNEIRFSSTHETGFLGIHSDHISKEKAEKLGFKNKFGSYVSKVVKNSAADKAGLQLFDYIYGVEDQRTSDNQDLSDILADYDPGEKVKLYFIRNGNEKSIDVELGDYEDFDWNQDNEESAFLGVSPSNNERRNDMDGVNITVVNGSAAEEMGLENNDIIKAINGHPVLDWDDVGTIVDNLRPGDQVDVIVKRGDQEITKSGNLKEHNRGNYSITSGDNGNNNDWSSNWSKGEKWGGTKGAFLGVYIDKLSEKKARALGFDNPYGSYVSGVIKNTAADKAGIMPFDYIIGIDEYRVGEEQYLNGILRKYEPGDEATVHFYRKGKRVNKSIVFRVYTEAIRESKDKCEDPFMGIIELEKESGQKGVKVKPVSNSTAMDIGLESGDIITYVNGYQMYDWTDIGIAINMLAPGDKIEVDYIRDGKKMKGSGNILSYAKTKKCKDCDCGESRNRIVIDNSNFSIQYPKNLKRERYDTDSRKDVDDVIVSMEDVSDSEMRNMVSKGVDMEVSNDLRVENLELSSNSDIGMFELQFDLDTEGETMVNVYNPAGRSIYEYDLGKFSGDFSDHIDISQNGAGTYFLKISQNRKSFVRKIVLTDN